MTPYLDAVGWLSPHRQRDLHDRRPTLPRRIFGAIALAALTAACGGAAGKTRSTPPTSSAGTADQYARTACRSLPQVPWFVAPVGQAPPAGFTEQQKAQFADTQLQQATSAATTAAARDPRWQHLLDLTEQLAVDNSFLERGSPAPGDVTGLGLALAIACQQALATRQ